jgi:hypothetical protein
MIFIANLMRIHFARTPQEIGKIPWTDSTCGLVIKTHLDLGFEYAKFFRLL